MPFFLAEAGPGVLVQARLAFRRKGDAEPNPILEMPDARPLVDCEPVLMCLVIIAGSESGLTSSLEPSTFLPALPGPPIRLLDDLSGIMVVGLAEAMPDILCRSLYLGLSFLSGTGIERPMCRPGEASSTSTGVVRGTSKDCLLPGVMWPRRDKLEALRICDQPELR